MHGELLPATRRFFFEFCDVLLLQLYASALQKPFSRRTFGTGGLVLLSSGAVDCSLCLFPQLHDKAFQRLHAKLVLRPRVQLLLRLAFGLFFCATTGLLFRFTLRLLSSAAGRSASADRVSECASCGLRFVPFTFPPVRGIFRGAARFTLQRPVIGTEERFAVQVRQ